MSDNYDDKQENQFLEWFKTESELYLQLKGISIALSNKEHSAIIKELVKNQSKYKNLIEFIDPRSVDKIGKDLIGQVIMSGRQTFLLDILSLDFYQKNRDRVINAHCYTSLALEKKRPGMAKILYEKGFFNKEVLIRNLENKSYPLNKVFNYLMDDGYCPSIAQRLKYVNDYKFDEYLEKINLDKIDRLFKENKSVFSWSNIELSNQVYMNCDGQLMPFKLQNFKMILKLLKKLEQSNIDIEEHMDRLMGKMGENKSDEFSPYVETFLKSFPKRREQLLNQMGQDKPWIVKFVKKSIQDSLGNVGKKVKKKIKI